jgi:putative inorganic carbon (hco3(-)) transporter
MRALALLLTLLSTVPLGYFRPFAGVLVWSWLNSFAPQDLIFHNGWPVVYWTALVTFAGLVTSREAKRLPKNPAPWLLLIFMLWVTFTTSLGFVPGISWVIWNKNIKTLVLALTIMVVMTNRVRVQALVWVMVVSIGYYSLKGGIFTFVTGGAGQVYGGAGDNNNLGTMMVMILPLTYYLYLHSAVKWVKVGLLVMIGATVLAVLGTYSRGAFLALAVVVGYFWWKSKRKMVIGVVCAVLLPAAIYVMPPQWLDRMRTIDTYQQDASAEGRLEEWSFAWRIAKDRPFIGGGFDAVALPSVAARYGERLLTYHSIWFEALGDHGFPGFLLYLAMGLMGWINASIIRRRAGTDPDLAWARDLATMLQVSIAGFYAGGTFLSMAYYDGYFSLLSILAVVPGIIVKQRKGAPRFAAPAPLAPPVPLESTYATTTMTKAKI